MKRRFLPLSLFLIFTMLGGLLLSSSNIMQSKKYVERSNLNDALSYGNKQSAEYLKLLRNNQNTGLINPRDLIEVQKQLSEMKFNRSGFDLEWNELGPDNFGGRTRAIVFDNKDTEGKTAIAGAVGGGLWKTTNMGTSWSKINTSTANLNVSCMIQTNGGDIYVGTGESFSSQEHSAIGQMGYSSGFMGKGLYKSTDGENFSLISSTKPTLNNQDADFAYINEVAFDETKSVIYTSTNNGLKYSSDGGSSWSIAKDSEGNELIDNSTDVHAATSGLVIASVNNMAYVSYDGNSDNFLLRSYDDSTGMLPVTNVKRIEFAIAPSDENIIYASLVNQFEEIYNVYRSENKGESWDIVMPGSESLNVLGGQGVYNNTIKVYPNNPNKILVGGNSLWLGESTDQGGFFAWESVSQGMFNMFDDYLHINIHDVAFSGNSANNILVGTDGGVYIGKLSGGQYNYTTGNRNYITTQFYSVGYSGVPTYVIGGAQGNGSILITGTGNTAKQGKEIMGTGLAFQDGDDGGPAVISLINKDVLVASTTFGDIRRSDDGGENYSTNSQFLDGIGNVNAFLSPMALWETFDNPNSRDSITFFNRTGETISQGTETMAQSANSDQPFYFDMPNNLSNGDSIRIVDPVSSRFFLATANHIYMISDLHNFAKTPGWWEIANSDFTEFGGIPQCIAYSSDANHVFVGTQSGELFRISNLALAYNFERADVSSPSCIVSVDKIPIYEVGTTDEISQIITSISVDPENSNNILVTLGNYGNEQYLMYSSNALAQTPTFESKQGNLPKMPVYSSVIEMKPESDIAIIGTENGIFSTANITAASPSWEADYSTMGSVPVFDLKQQLIGKEKMTVTVGDEEFIYEGVHNKGLIYAASFGRGLLYTSKFWQPAVGINEIEDNNSKYLSLDVFPNPASDIVNININSESNGNAQLSIYDLSGKMLLQTEATIVNGENKLNLNISSLNNGTYILKTVAEGKVYSNKITIN